MHRAFASLLAATALTCVAPVPALASAATAQQPAEGLPPLYAEELERAKNFVDTMIEAGINVPLPKDPGGGYTHEQHKRNFQAIHLGGDLYRITKDPRYAAFVRDILLEYAELYPTLKGDHPAASNQYSGRLFWQVLNDAMWLVHAVQGYAEIRDTLSDADRERIDNDVFRRASDFLSKDQVRTFDRIHNHATWATAGVGMTGYLLGDRDMVDRALLGSDKSGKAGFLRQMDLLFSPDGYYTEGPYYQRFALLPFMVFGQAIADNDPAQQIFERRDGILLKALRATVQLTYAGYFFPFNDAMKDKSLRTAELYDGVAIAYGQTRDPALLFIAQWQGRTVLGEDGLMLARDLEAGKAQPFPFRSMLFSDGPDGDLGAVAVLRAGEGAKQTALVAKNSSQGMGHGHFDKLSWQFYDNGNEIVRDYGAARFLNIEAKQGGRYLPENESWAKQTIAHNTLVVDEVSHFGGDARLADTIAPRQLYFSDVDGLQVSSAEVTGAYEDVAFDRTLVLTDMPGGGGRLVIDLLRADAQRMHVYDLPLHYNGHIMEADFAIERNLATRPVLGGDHGYQHLWVDGTATPDAGDAALTWLIDGRFYSYRFVTDGTTQVVLGESGANDPEFNLRREPMVMLRARADGGHSFLSVLESHGQYDGADERTVASRSQIASLRHVVADGNDIAVITPVGGAPFAIAISHDPDPARRHQAKLDGQTIRWTGFAARIALTPKEQRK
jgi:oligo-alginate lyase